MKIKSYVLVAAVVLFLSIMNFAQESTGPRSKRARSAEDYKPRTLKELAVNTSSSSENRTNKEETMLVTPKILPSRVRVTFKGSTRDIPQIKKEVLAQWARLYAGAPEFYTKPYETEMLFTEEGDEHWLAVKKDLLPRLKHELKERDEVDLYIIRVGSASISNRWEPMLLVENFQKPRRL